MEPLFDRIEADLTAAYGEDAALARVAGVRRLAGLLPGYLAVDEQEPLGLVLYNQANGFGRIAFARAQTERQTILASLVDRAMTTMRANGVREISADEEYAGQSIGPVLSRMGFAVCERLSMTATRLPAGAPDWPVGYRLVSWREELFGVGARVLYEAFCDSPDAVWDGRFRSPEGTAQALRGLIAGRHGPLDSDLSFMVFGGSVPCGIVLITRRPVSSGYILTLGLSPSVRGRGLGRALTHEAVERVIGSGLAQTELTVAAENDTAVNLYRRLGFAVTETNSSFVWSASEKSANN